MNKKLKTLVALALVAGTLSFGGVCASADTIQIKDDSNVVGDYLPVTSDEAAAKLIDMTSLKVSQKEAKPGDTVKVSFKAKEKLTIAMVTFIKPISGKGQTVNVKYNEETGLYEGNITVTDESESGQWRMTRILLKAETSNTFGSIFDKNLVVGATNGEDLSAADFNVSGTKVTSKNDLDLQGPDIDVSSLSIDKTEANPRDLVKFSLKAKDPSGISWAALTYQTPQGNLKMCSLKYNEASGKYEGAVEVYDEIGAWKVYDIVAVDNENNQTYVSNKEIPNEGGNPADLSAGNFEVNEPVKPVDVTAPIIDTASVSAHKIVGGLNKNEFELTLKATDDVSGIKSIKACYVSPSNKETEIEILQKDLGDTYKVCFGFLTQEEVGTWKISYIEATDNDGNTAKYTADQYDFSAADIEMEEIEKRPAFNLPGIKPMNPGPIRIDPSKIDPSKMDLSKLQPSHELTQADQDLLIKIKDAFRNQTPSLN